MWPSAAEILPICLALGLAALLVGEFLVPGPGAPEAAALPMAAATPVPRGLQVTGDAAEALDRPLFNPGRRLTDAPGTAAPDRLEDYRLAGSVRTARGAVALFSGPDGRARSVGVGADLAGWRVQSIDAHGVRLTLGDTQKVMTPAPGSAPPPALLR